MRKKIFTAGGLILFCVIAVVVGRQFSLSLHEPSFDQRALLRSHGDPKAPLWIVEYLDYQCGSCRVASGILEEYSKKYPGKIYSQVRYFPLRSHQHALKAAIYAECSARQGRFWNYHTELLHKQKIWSRASFYEIDDFFINIARGQGLDERKMTACVEDPKIKETVLEEAEVGRTMGVRQTPSLFMNGKMVVGHEALLEELKNYFSGVEKAER